MGTQLDRLDEVEAATVRVRRLVEKKVEESRVVAAVEDGAEEVVGMLAEHDAPAPGRDHEARADRAAQRAQQRTAGCQGKQGCVQHGFHDVALAARHLVDPVLRLELLEEQLHLPTEGVDAGDVGGRERVDTDVGEVEVLVPGSLVTYADDAERPHLAALAAGVAAVAGAHLDHDVEFLALEPIHDVPDALAHHGDGLPAPDAILRHDHRVAAALQSRDEVAAEVLDAPEELEIVRTFPAAKPRTRLQTKG